MFSRAGRITREIGRALAIGASLALAACSRDAAPAPDVVAEWTVEAQPLLTLGLAGADGDGITLERITGATRLDDGSLIVADLGDTPLAMYGADGQLLRRLARKGMGPGEMEYLARMWRCGDAIYAYDIEGYRTSEHSLSGEYRRTFQFKVPTGQQTPYVSACDARGRFAHLGWGMRGPPTAGYHRDTVPLWVTPAADGAPSIVDSVAASERWGQVYEGRVVGSTPLPLGRQPHIAYGASAFFVATGDAFELRAYDSTGAALPSLRLTDSVPMVTPADVKDYVEAEILESGERRRASIEREYGAITFPERHAAITALIADREGLLWLRSYAPASASAAIWRVLSPEGREVARVALPRRLEVFEIGRDYVLGREIDAGEGVPVLRLLRLNRSAAP